MSKKKISNSYQIPTDEVLILLNDTEISTDLTISNTTNNTLNNSVGELASNDTNVLSYSDFLN